MKNKKRYLLIILMVLTLLLGSGCNKEPQREMSIEEIVAKHYDQDFNYTKTNIREDEDGEITSKTVFVCEYEHDPYYEHVARDYDNSFSQEIVVGPSDVIVTMHFIEKTMSGDGDIIKSEIVTLEQTAVQYVPRSYYSGYGEDITYTYVEETELDGVAVSLYHAEYIEDHWEVFGISDVITGVVTQEYYIDHTENQIVKIVTHLVDYNDKAIAYASYKLEQGASKEEIRESYLKVVEEDEGGEPTSSRREEILFYDYR